MDGRDACRDNTHVRMGSDVNHNQSSDERAGVQCCDAVMVMNENECNNNKKVFEKEKQKLDFTQD